MEKLLRIENETFTDATLVIDGHHFTGCTFIRCLLRYSGGPFEIEHCEIQEQMVEFQAAARWTLYFLRRFGWSLPDGMTLGPEE